MAKIWFSTPEGDEKSYKLDKFRTLRIGRDPGNDIVLRDARVSRQHAQIVYERGFFVIHDLSSANGTYVNGRRVRVAPLSDGAEMRLGNTLARFSEEVPEPEPPPQPTVTFDLDDARRRGATPDPDSLSTSKHEKSNPPVDLQKKTDAHKPLSHPGTERVRERVTELEFPVLDDSGDQTGEIPAGPDTKSENDHGPPSPPGEESRQEDAFRLTRYLIDVAAPDRDRATVRNEAEQPLFYFRRQTDLVGCVAAVMAGIVITAGVAASFILVSEHTILPALLAIALMLGFSTVILWLVPRKHFYVYDDAAMKHVALLAWQESRFSFPSLRYSARLGDGTVIAAFERRASSRLGRHRWWIYDRHGTAIGSATETSFVRAFFHNFLGSLFGIFRSDFRIVAHGLPVGVVKLDAGPLDRRILDLTADAHTTFDRRIALVLAVIIDRIEAR